jgi:hypothetical protein
MNGSMLYYIILTSHAIEARAKARDCPSPHRLRESSQPIMNKRKSGPSFSQGPAIASHIGDHCAGRRDSERLDILEQRRDSERLDILEQHAYHQNRAQRVHVTRKLDLCSRQLGKRCFF